MVKDSSKRPTLLALCLLIIPSLFLWWLTRPKTPDLPAPALKVLAAKHHIAIGNYASLRRLNDKPYTDILTSQYDFATVDGEPNWTFNDGSLRPSAKAFDYRNIDSVMTFAKSHQLPVQVHHLVWGEEKWLPAWLKQSHYARKQLLELMHQHIEQVAGHYRGQVREWTVVNEPFSRQTHYNGLNDWWADHTGGQGYIDLAFRWAHQADPAAKLLLNDFGNESLNPISDASYKYLKAAKARGVPIDGLGMQMHISGDKPPGRASVIANMQRFAKLGLKIYVTEFDVNMTNVKGTTADRWAKQALIYQDMLRACIESRVCVSFAELGITDKESWYNELNVPNAEPLPFDRHYRPKPAFWALRTALEQ